MFAKDGTSIKKKDKDIIYSSIFIRKCYLILESKVSNRFFRDIMSSKLSFKNKHR